VRLRNSAKAIIIRDGHLLATRHVDADGDWYLLPGGGQEPGETLVEAVRRECREETGALIEVCDLKLVREYIGRNHEFAEEDADAHQVEFMFECRLRGSSYQPALGGTPDISQIGVVWLPLPDLTSSRLYPSVLRTLLASGVPDGPPIYLGDVN
jgi:8-oxo-dGTP pyrophosphatase MutT (NUDIX family)